MARGEAREARGLLGDSLPAAQIRTRRATARLVERERLAATTSMMSPASFARPVIVVPTGGVRVCFVCVVRCA